MIIDYIITFQGSEMYIYWDPVECVLEQTQM